MFMMGESACRPGSLCLVAPSFPSLPLLFILEESKSREEGPTVGGGFTEVCLLYLNHMAAEQ